MNRRRRRNSMVKKPLDIKAMVLAGIGAGMLVMFMIFVAVAIMVKGDTPNFLGGMSVLCMIASIVALFMGVSELKLEQFDPISRYAGVIFPAIASVLWMLIYLAGLLVG